MTKQVRTKEGSLIPVDASAVIVSIDGKEMTLQQALDEGKTGKDIVIVQVLSDSTEAVPSAHAVKTSVDAVSASVSLLAQNVAELGTSKQNILTPGTGITISSDGVISASGVVGPQGPQGPQGPAGKDGKDGQGDEVVAGDNVTITTTSDGKKKISAQLPSGTTQSATQVAYTNGQTTTAGGTVADKLTELDGRVNDVCGSNTPSTTEQTIDDYANVGLLWNAQGIIKSDQTSYKTSDYVAIDLTRLQSLNIVAMMGNTYGGGICFYDSDKNYISNIYHTSSNWQDNESYQVSIADIPSKAAYFRTCGIIGTTKTKAKYTLVQHSTNYGIIGNNKSLFTQDKTSITNAINEIVSANRLSINIYTTDTEVEILNKMIKARETKNVDVYWQYGTYTFSSVYGYMKNTLGWGWTMGLPIGGNCRYFFNGSTLISNPLEGYTQERNILDTKACAENFELYDGVLINNGGIYCVHDEGLAKSDFYVHRYQNMMMEYRVENPDASSISKCIGGGCGLYGMIDINGCTFATQGVREPVSWHGNNETEDLIDFHINIRSCYFANGSISLDSNLRDNEKGELIFVGNSCTKAPITRNWTAKIGNNEIRQ